MQERADKAGLNNPRGKELQARLGAKDSSLPFFAFLDANGLLIVNSLRPVAGRAEGANIGHPFEPEEVDWFMVMLKKAAAQLSPEEARVVEAYLRNQKLH